MDNLLQECNRLLNKFCVEIHDRSVGTDGNKNATDFFYNELKSLNWNCTIQEFDAIDWNNNGATLSIDKKEFDVFVSPYSKGGCFVGELISAKSLEELKEIDANNKILLLYGDISKEQIMPKNFVFYNPEHHKETISLLERCGALALVCGTGRNSSLAGGVYPFPLIEDGDFDVPSVYMTDEEGQKLLKYLGKNIVLNIKSNRIKSKGCNVIGNIGNSERSKIAITAHIDAKKGTPGAIDNATGIVILLLVASMLRNYNGNNCIEIIAFNGEDYFSAPGQMKYIANKNDNFNDIILNINIDGAGYREGKSAFSFYNLGEKMHNIAYKQIENYDEIIEGEQWYQGDHSIFIQKGIPAISVTSEWFLKNIETQDITHTPKDNISIVDCKKLVKIAKCVKEIVNVIY